MTTKRLREMSMFELGCEAENTQFSIRHDGWLQPALGAQRRRLTAIRKEIGRRWGNVLHANWERGRLRLNGTH